MSRNHCLLITLGMYVLICCTPTISERCSVTVSKAVLTSVTIQKSSQQKYKTKCGLYGWTPCTRYRTVYFTAYTTHYRKIYEIQYKNCPECSDWKFTENLCQTCGNCQPCKCNQANSESCNKRDGSCTCNEGWNGEICDNKCEIGMYGNNCTQQCQCNINNTVSCDHHDGTCRCKPGWIGSTCNQTCSEGWHGDNCEERCICKESTTIHCDEQNGTCYCVEGWWGSDCSEWVEDITGLPNATNSNRPGGKVADATLQKVMVAVISILTLFIALTVAVFVIRRYCKRRNVAKGDHISNELTSTHGAQAQVCSGGGYEPRPANNHDEPTSNRRNEGEAVERQYTDLQDIRDGLYTGLRQPDETEYSEVESPYKSLEQVNAGFYMGLRRANVQNEREDHSEILNRKQSTLITFI